MGRTGQRGLGDERDESLTDSDGVGWDGVGRRRRGSTTAWAGLGWRGSATAWVGLGWRGSATAWAGMAWVGDGVGWDGVGRRRRGLGNEKDESLRDERDDESLRVMMRVHGDIEIE